MWSSRDLELRTLTPPVYGVIEYIIFGEGSQFSFNQSEARRHCILASDWLKLETLPRKYRGLFYQDLPKNRANLPMQLGLFHDTTQANN